jgi:hypothetical protein
MTRHTDRDGVNVVVAGGSGTSRTFVHFGAPERNGPEPAVATPKRPPPPWPVFQSASLPPPAATGGTVSGAAEAIASLAPYFRRCYNRALFDDPRMQRSVRITSKIGADGTVMRATWGTDEGLSPQLCDCLKRAVLAQRFHPPDGGGATLVVPISFAPQPPAGSPVP